MSVTKREFCYDGIQCHYYLVSGRRHTTPAYTSGGRLYVQVEATGGNISLQDAVAFEKVLEREIPEYYAQLEAFRLAGKLGVLDQYFEISERHPYTRRIFRLAKIESGA